MNIKRCPECGSKAIIEKKKNISIKEPFADEINIEINENVCSSCGSQGDFSNQNETLIEETIKNLKQKSIKNILNDFTDNKMSMSSIERALEMPQRTLTKWKNNTNYPSSAGIALIRFIKLFPWLLEVAENKYDYNEAQKIHINTAIEKLLLKIYSDTEILSEASIEHIVKPENEIKDYKDLKSINQNANSIEISSIEILLEELYRSSADKNKVTPKEPAAVA
jgi:transposase-like protein